MGTTIVDIQTQATHAFVPALGGTNALFYGSFDYGLSSIIPAAYPYTDPVGTDHWETFNVPTLALESVNVFEGTTSLQWSNGSLDAAGALREVVDAAPYRGKTIHMTGYLKADTNVGATAQLGFWSEWTTIPPGESEDDDPDGTITTNVYLSPGGRFRIDYDNSAWTFFHVYYRVPDDVALTQIGPMIRPVTPGTDKQTVYVDNIKLYSEPKDRSEDWRIDVVAIDKQFYGYGYGNAFRGDDITLSSAFDYFRVIGVAGTTGGFGLQSTIVTSDLPANLYALSYNYAFGYEDAPAFLSDEVDTLQVKATVYENDVKQAGVKVFFKSSPDVILTPSVVTTNADGEAITNVSMSKDALQRTKRIAELTGQSAVPINGFLRIEAEIEKHSRENDSVLLINTQSVQLTATDVSTTLNIGSYAFQTRYGAAFPGPSVVYGYGA